MFSSQLSNTIRFKLVVKTINLDHHNKNKDTLHNKRIDVAHARLELYQLTSSLEEKSMVTAREYYCFETSLMSDRVLFLKHYQSLVNSKVTRQNRNIKTIFS